MSAQNQLIRDLDENDLDAVLPLLNQLGYEVDGGELALRYAQVAKQPEHLLLAAEVEGQLAGFLHAFVRPALEKPVEVIVQSMVVERHLRRSGTGRALMAETENWARERGYRSIALNSQVERGDAHAFYQSLGFVRVATSELLRKAL